MKFDLFGYEVIVRKIGEIEPVNTGPLPPTLMEQVIAVAATKSSTNPTGKIQRIKAYREVTGEGLKESKEWVDTHFHNNGSGDPIV